MDVVGTAVERLIETGLRRVGDIVVGTIRGTHISRMNTARSHISVGHNTHNGCGINTTAVASRTAGTSIG